MPLMMTGRVSAPDNDDDAGAESGPAGEAIRPSPFPPFLLLLLLLLLPLPLLAI